MLSLDTKILTKCKVVVKVSERPKLKYFQKIKERVQYQRFISKVKKLKTVKQFIHLRCMEEIRKLLDGAGIAGSMRMDYINFGKKALRIFFLYVYPNCYRMSAKQMQKAVDLILDFLEVTHMEVFKLEPKIVATIEKIFVDSILKIPEQAEEFKKLKEQKEVT